MIWTLVCTGVMVVCVVGWRIGTHCTCETIHTGGVWGWELKSCWIAYEYNMSHTVGLMWLLSGILLLGSHHKIQESSSLEIRKSLVYFPPLLGNRAWEAVERIVATILVLRVYETCLFSFILCLRGRGRCKRSLRQVYVSRAPCIELIPSWPIKSHTGSYFSALRYKQCNCQFQSNQA